MLMLIQYNFICPQSKDYGQRNAAPALSWFSRVRRLFRPIHRIINPDEGNHIL